MSRRYIEHGQRFGYQHRTGYQDRARVPGPLLPMETPEGETSTFKAVMALLFVALVVVGIVAALS